MKVSDLKKMTADELKKEMAGLLREQFNMRMQQGTGQSIRPHLIKNARKNVARIKTILKEKAMMGEKHE